MRSRRLHDCKLRFFSVVLACLLACLLSSRDEVNELPNFEVIIDNLFLGPSWRMTMRITLRGDCNHVMRHLSLIVTSACTGHDDILSPGLVGYIDSNVNSRTLLHSQVCVRRVCS